MRPFAFLAILAAMSAPAPAGASLVEFTGTDAGAGPGDAHPVSDAAAARFDAAAAALGPRQTITFADLAPGQPAADNMAMAIGAGVNLSLQGADHNTLAPGFNFGVTSSPASAIYGFSTVPGVANFFEFAPRLNVGTASMTFTFAAATPFFGLYLTGLGTANGDLHVVFNDRVARDIDVPGSSRGGVQFFGFVDPGAQISKVTLELLNVRGSSRDLFGIDGVRTLAVPEPPSAALAVLGGIALLGYRRGWRRPRPAAEGPAPAAP